MSCDLRTAGRLVSLALASSLACSQASISERVLVEIPLDHLDEVITRSSITIDPEITTDGGGSIRVDAADSMVVRIAEIDDLSIENERLIYRARVRSEELRGRAYLEMWCGFPGQGEFFSRALQSPLSGTNDWATQETPFFLQKGQDPRLVKLNLVIEGAGTVWLDEVVLATAPL